MERGPANSPGPELWIVAPHTGNSGQLTCKGLMLCNQPPSYRAEVRRTYLTQCIGDLLPCAPNPKIPAGDHSRFIDWSYTCALDEIGRSHTIWVSADQSQLMIGSNIDSRLFGLHVYRLITRLDDVRRIYLVSTTALRFTTCKSWTTTAIAFGSLPTTQRQHI